MYMKKSLIYLALLFIFTVCRAQTEVKQYVPGATAESVTYFLPKTALRLTVIAEKEVYTPGQFCKYANRYLRLTDVEQDGYTRWRITSIILTPYGVPDATKSYSILFKKKTVAPLVSLTADGIILGINCKGEEDAAPALPELKEAKKHLNPRDYMSQDILSAGSNAKIAELTAEEIYDLRESRTALIKGEADNMPKDGAQLRLMLEQLSLQETALSQLFKGIRDTTTEVFNIELTPTEYIDKMVLFRFSEKLGILDGDDLAGDPIYLSLSQVNVLPEPSEEENEKKKGKPDDGVFYNVPGRATAKVYSAEQEFCKREIPMAQFGSVETLGSALFDKKTPTQVLFYSSNGGIKQIIETTSGEK